MDIALPVTSLAAVLSALLILALTLRVVQLRRAGGVVLGDNGDRAMQKAIRGQANATEQVPIFLIVLGLAELGGSPAAVIWPVALLFLAGRVSHGLYFGRHGLHWRFRTLGMWATVVAQAGAILALLFTLG